MSESPLLNDELLLRLDDFVDSFVVRGAHHADVLDAIEVAVVKLREAYSHDPDPTDDTGVAVDEPSNDWPSAT